MTRAQEKLVVEGMWLVDRVARRLKHCLPRRIDIRDMISVGHLGLVKAALKFEPKRDVPFAVYARIRIRGEIQDQMRRDSNISRKARARGDREPATLSVNETLAGGIGHIGDDLVDHRIGPDRKVLGDDSRDHIIQMFTGRDRRIFEMLHVDGHDMKFTAAIIGISESRVCQINKRLRATVRRHLDGEALDAAS